MSLVSDSDFLIHSIRLSYLRNVEDPYGPRLISLSPSYNLNPYITAASLADVSKWPELAAPASPHLSDDDVDRPSGFPGATGLKHTQTIMGSKSGGIGLRVSGSRRPSSFNQVTSRRREVKSGSSETPLASATTIPVSPTPKEEDRIENGHNVPQLEKAGGSVLSQSPSTELDHGVVPADPPANAVQFVPLFKGAAEVEARRRMRMLAHRNPGKVGIILPQPAPNLNLELSSSSSSTDMIGDDIVESSDELVSGGGGSVDDEFDPDFAATRALGVNSDSASEVLSLMSGANSVTSTSNSLVPTSSLHTSNTRIRHRLSPVSESRTNKDRTHSSSKRIADKSIDSNFEMITQLTKADQTATHTQRKPGGRQKSTSNLTTVPAQTSELTFSRCKVQTIRPLKSALTAMLASSETSSNPFAENYAAISGRAETSSMTVHIYFPHTTEPAGKAMSLDVRKDATVEEVIGFGLWSYWEAGWLPKLDEGLDSGDSPRREAKLTSAGWIMRIAEDDGEVDDEFPPPDRTGKISKFSFDAYAVLEASPAQFQQNQIHEGKIQRRPSRTTIAKKPERPVQGGLTVPSPAPRPAGTNIGSMLGSTPLSTSLGPSSSYGPQIFLRIRVADTADAVHISTTIPVSAGMYMQEALELVCRKRKLPNPRDYALLLGDMSLLIPLDRTVASLQGKKELVLVKRSVLPALGIDLTKGAQKTTDPNASIFKRMSEVPEVPSLALDYTAAYKKYVIYRKMPMMVTRQERTLAIDGPYIHIMPATNKAKAVFDNVKTFSYNISSIAGCQQSTKSSSTFKLIVNRDGAIKRYDFEAESPKLANEIVQTLRGLKAAVERSSSGNKSRRSRHVV